MLEIGTLTLVLTRLWDSPGRLGLRPGKGGAVAGPQA
jgi:hypothetical protein